MDNRQQIKPYINKLNVTFNVLRKHKVIKEKDYSEKSLADFERLINDCVPQTFEERCWAEVVRFMYKKNKTSFIKYITSANCVSFCLLTDGYLIAKMLNIIGGIIIKWDSEQRKYFVGDSSQNLNKSGEFCYNSENKSVIESFSKFKNTNNQQNNKLSRFSIRESISYARIQDNTLHHDNCDNQQLYNNNQCQNNKITKKEQWSSDGSIDFSEEINWNEAIEPPKKSWAEIASD